MKLFGELYNYNFLNDKIIYVCLIKLLKNIADSKIYSILMICNLLESCGKKFSTNNHKDFDIITQKLKLLSESGKIEMKEIFAIKDILESF
jgi:hypothetical protein